MKLHEIEGWDTGTKVKMFDWGEHEYLYFDASINQFLDEEGGIYEFATFELVAEDWEVCEHKDTYYDIECYNSFGELEVAFQAECDGELLAIQYSNDEGMWEHPGKTAVVLHDTKNELSVHLCKHNIGFQLDYDTAEQLMLALRTYNFASKYKTRYKIKERK